MLVLLDILQEREYDLEVVWQGHMPLLAPRDSNPNEMWRTPRKVHRNPAHVFVRDVDDVDGNEEQSPLSGGLGEKDEASD